MIKKKHIPFNLKAAQSGSQIETRDGRIEKFIAFLPDAVWNQQLITLSKWGRIRCVYADGRVFSEMDSESDVVMSPKQEKNK